MSVATSNILALQPTSSPPHYRASPSFTFHPYEHESPHGPLIDEHIAPPTISTRRAARISAPFPTFLYASEPPPLTARNKQRVRPSAAQLAELKALYAATPHPAREVREALGSRIGMRYQSVTNWFQNQRSTAKKRGPVANQTRTAAPPRTRSRSTSRSRMLSPSPACSLSHLPEDNMDDSYTSGDDDVHQRSSMEHRENNHDDHLSPTPRTRTRTDPVKDIIVAQATARQQQQMSELALPLSGAAIVPSSSFSDLEKDDSPYADTEFNITLPPAPRTTSAPAPAPSSRAPTPLLSSFQLSRAPSPSAASTNASVFDTCGEEMHSAEADYGEGAMADQVPRGKRSRPTPHQLAALRALHSVTSSPSIEERTRVGREIGMELGKVTNWFRNLRQTARKKERRALEAEGLTQPSKRGRNGEFSRSRHNKRTRLALGDDDAMSAFANMSHVHSGSFETSSTVDSVDMDYDYEHPDAYFVQHCGKAFVGSREAYLERPSFGEYDNPRLGLSTSFDGPAPGYLLPIRRHDETQLEGHPEHEHEHEHDHDLRSELGTESDAAHEAVTPEPQSLAPCTERIPPTPHSMTAASSRNSPSPADADHRRHPNSHHSKHPSVDDAMLLLAFHGART